MYRFVSDRHGAGVRPGLRRHGTADTKMTGRAIRGPSFPLVFYSEPPAPDDAAPDFSESPSRCDEVVAAGVDVGP